MKNKFIVISLFLIAMVIMAAAPERSSSGAPGGHTGAPGEQNCATSGCHDDNSINSGAAILSIQVGDSIANYTPGQTYAVKVKISESAVNRFGFQLLALNNSTQESTGAFQITDVVRTQMTSIQTQPGREYVTYTFNGTDAASNMSEWTVNWTAPSTAVGSVSFYAAAVSANDDMTDKGDHVYTASKRLNRIINTTVK